MRLIWRTIALVLGVLSSPCWVRADVGDERYAAAAAHYGQEQWQAAADEFARLLEDHADHPRANQARFYYGEALSQLGHYVEARAQFGALLKSDPQGRYARQSLFRAAEAAYLAEDEPAARRDFEAFRQRFPQDELNAYVLAHLGNLQLKAGQAAAAGQLFATAIKEFPDSPLADECRFGQAEAHEQQGQHDEARGGYREVIAGKGPLADQSLLHLAALENAEGHHADALTTLEQLDRDYPDSPIADKGRLGRGYALYKLGRHAEAEAALASLLNKPGLRVDAHYWLGLAQKGRQAWSEAAQTLAVGAQLEPEHRLSATLGYQAADALWEAGKFQAAADQFEKVGKQWPNSPWADDCQLGKLHACARLNEHAECVRLADAFAAQFPDSPLRWQVDLVQGRALYALGKYAEAVAPLERCLARKAADDQPANAAPRADAQQVLTLCYTKLGRLAEANQTLAQRRQGKPADETNYQVAEAAYAAGDLRLANELFAAMAGPENSPEMIQRGLSGLAWCRFKNSQWAEAATAFDKVLTQFPAGPQAAEAALMRGRALEHTGDLETALAMHHVVLDRYGDSPRAVEALWQAARLHDQLQQPEQALELYARLVKEHADFAEVDAAIFRWALLLRASEKPEDATKAGELFERLRREHPDSRFATEATLRLAEQALAARKYDTVQSLLTEITGPATPPAVLQPALYLQARAALGAEQWSAAEAPLGELLEKFPDGSWALPAAYLRAESQFRQGHFEQAAAQLAELAEKTREHAESWSATGELRRAQCLVHLKEWSEALDVANTIEARFAGFEDQHEVDYLIGRCLAAQADFAGARAAYAKVIESPRGGKTQTAAMARWMTGESYLHQENYAAALAEYVQLDESCPFPRWQAAALLQAGKCHEQLNDWQTAAEDYDRLLQTFPTSEFADEATRRGDAARTRAQSTASPTKKLK